MSIDHKQILLMVSSLSNEKGVGEDVVFESIEKAIAAVTARNYPETAVINVNIDKDTGHYESFRCWTVVESPEELEDPEFQILLSEAQEADPDLKAGDIIEEPIDTPEFGRIEAQHARQVIFKNVREAERQKIMDRFRRHIGDLVNGTVKRVMRELVIVDLGDNVEGTMLREEMIPRENVHLGDRIRAYLYDVEDERRGPRVMLTRSRPGMLKALFEIEVPEISEEVIEIKAIARDPGSRAKIAVKTNDGRIDPVGACVGMRGSRVQMITGELNGERIDVVLYDDNPAQFVINAMAPAEVVSIVVDDDKKSMDIAVRQDQLSQAIGRNGQNVHLASELTGWTLNIMTEEEAELKGESEVTQIRDMFVKDLDVDETVADIFIEAGFTTLEEIAYVPETELLKIDGFDADIVEELRNRANDVLLARAISGAGADESEDEADLFAVEGMTEALSQKLMLKGISNREELAEQSVDDLTDIEGLDADQAADLIMKARAHWFTDED